MTLDERLSSDSEILKSAAALFGFYAAAQSGSPLGLGAGIILITTAATAAVAAASTLIKRLNVDDKELSEETTPTYERFRVMFYTLCLQCYLEAIKANIAKLNSKKDNKLVAEGTPKLAETDLLQSLNYKLTQVNESEVPFLLGVDPLSGNVPLYQALNAWLTALLAHYGFPEFQTQGTVRDIVSEAKNRFQVLVSSDVEEFIWMKNYLLIRGGHQTEVIASDLSSVREALTKWLDGHSALRERQADSWGTYRKKLLALPDEKDSMYNESFGVRDVFVRPQGTYVVIGGSGESGKPQPVGDLGSVIGGLLSTRVSGEDLVLLCGGPGSGKSTLCRILASELALDEEVFPVFIRLRRLKEGADIPAFLETTLSQLGLIDRISDLKSLKNVVLILDGFDELVMASRARLRQFFNALREDHTNGPLKGMRIILSGRDTLFPGGEGLPLGCHVLTLKPFDKGRVSLWGEKWRARHQVGGGATFRPERLLSDNAGIVSALEHLVTWPLTLHLVARVHTSGKMPVSGGVGEHITKAILYKSILAETSIRQREQTFGGGRLEPDPMRKFLRALAWKMYEEGRESMDPSEVLPILKVFFPDKTEGDLEELAEVAVVNSPEITKGEQTGFEFVHKSFSEYLAAEKIAIDIERVTFQSQDFDSSGLTWRMSGTDAMSLVSGFLSFRLLTEEIQEMLEPMIGNFSGFSGGSTLKNSQREDGLTRIIARFESLLDSLLRGKHFHGFADRVRTSMPVSQYASQANLIAGVVLIGSAASRELSLCDIEKRTTFALQPFDGAFWRLTSVLQAGGVLINDHVAQRLFRNCNVGPADQSVDDIDLPIKPSWFQGIFGFSSTLSAAVKDQQEYLVELTMNLEIAVVLISFLLPDMSEKSPLQRELVHVLESIRHRSAGDPYWRHRAGRYPMLVDLLVENEFVSRDVLEIESVFEDEQFSKIMHLPKSSTTKDFMGALSFALEKLSVRAESRRNSHVGAYSEWLRVLLRSLGGGAASNADSSRLLERMRLIMRNMH